MSITSHFLPLTKIKPFVYHSISSILFVRRLYFGWHTLREYWILNDLDYRRSTKRDMKACGGEICFFFKEFYDIIFEDCKIFLGWCGNQFLIKFKSIKTQNYVKKINYEKYQIDYDPITWLWCTKFITKPNTPKKIKTLSMISILVHLLIIHHQFLLTCHASCVRQFVVN